uniref:Uncharacterized protein n=1 Tax=Ananas comosus var. bracteatus TaxID=296719 RepID=A0A6V7Q3Q2_ANACO|nr:unnamed protein product [Ananas comosus var. bracteatus]
MLKIQHESEFQHHAEIQIELKSLNLMDSWFLFMEAQIKLARKSKLTFRQVGDALITVEAKSALFALSRVILLFAQFETWILVVSIPTADGPVGRQLRARQGLSW